MLLDAAGRAVTANAKVLIYLNAVPPAGIEGIIKGAAAPLPAITISLVARKREVYADHIMASIHHPGSRNRRVNASGLRDQYLHSNRQFVIWTSTKPYEMLWQQRPAAQLQLDRHPQKKTDTRN